MLTLPFSALPGTTRLFLDYIDNAPSAARFFLGHFSDPMAWETHLRFLEKRSVHRPELVRILHRDNRSWGAGTRTIDAISAFGGDRTYAVVTGQQLGLFGGPLYTLYKAMTAVSLAGWLTERFPASTFVPVFWLEGEDHDLAEADRAAFITADNDHAVVHSVQNEEARVTNLRPTSAVRFDEGVHAAIDRLIGESTRTEFTPWVESMLRECHAPGQTMVDSFARFMHRLLPDSGIILLNPSAPDIKQLCAPVIMQELETHPASGEEVIKRSAELEELYHAQIKPRALNLFMTHKEGRYPIEPSDNGYFLKGTRQRFTRDELIALAKDAPERFSPNVLLRPIFQDYLLPTAAYVAGPAEIAYHAQLQPVYDLFQTPMPIVFPRASITLIEKKIQKVVGKFDLSYADMFDDVEAMYRRMTARTDEGDPLRALETFKSDLDELLQRLPNIASSIGPNLMDPAASTAANMQRALGVFTDKAYAAFRDRDTVVRRQLEKMRIHVAPDGKPQERVYSAVTFLNRYGPSLLPALAEACTPFPAEHRLHLL